MKNWHDTLNQALEAGGVPLEVWPLGLNLAYNQTGRIVSNGLFVSVCRSDLGFYETAISYPSLCEDFNTVVQSY